MVHVSPGGLPLWQGEAVGGSAPGGTRKAALARGRCSNADGEIPQLPHTPHGWHTALTHTCHHSSLAFCIIATSKCCRFFFFHDRPVGPFLPPCCCLLRTRCAVPPGSKVPPDQRVSVWRMGYDTALGRQRCCRLYGLLWQLEAFLVVE